MKRDTMGKTVLLAAVLLVTAATPAFAQGGQVAPPDGSAPPRDDGSLYSGAYEVTVDGDLIFGGDTGFECEYLVRMGAPAKPSAEDVTVDGDVVEPLTREAVELCAEAGFPPQGATFDASATSGASPPASSTSASASPIAPADATGDTRLPETGSPALPAPLWLATVVLPAAVAVLAFRTRR